MVARMTASEAGRFARVDAERVRQTSDEEIRRHAAEDGQDPGGYGDWYPTPGTLRSRLGLTQEEISGKLQIPVATWRNWEQGRVALDPAVRALLRVLDRILSGYPSPLDTARPEVVKEHGPRSSGRQGDDQQVAALMGAGIGAWRPSTSLP